MKALVWTGEKTLEMQERGVPEYNGKILIRVAYAGICGSDISVYLGKHPRAKAPLIMGHEFSGTVEAIGAGVKTSLKMGDAVVVNPLYFCGKCRACLQGNTHVCRSLRLYGTDTDGGMAEYAAVPEESVYRLPEGLPLSTAALVEPVAVVVHGLRMIKRDFYASACVTGLGPIGLLAALMLKDTGVRQLFAVEVNEERVDYAKRLGLEVINPAKEDCEKAILEQTGGEGVNVLIEASGSSAVAKIMTELAGVRAEILILSVFKEPQPLDLRALNFKEQSMIGTRVYTKLDFQDAVTYVMRHQDTVASIVSHIFPLREGGDVFRDLTSKRTNMMKVLLRVEQNGTGGTASDIE